MAHVREQIRDQVKLLLTGLATTGARVFKGDPGSRASSERPALFINSRDEAAESMDIGGRLQRELDLVITGIADAESDVEAVLNQIASEVETALTRTLNGLAIHSYMGATEFTKSNDEDNDANFGAINLVLRVIYVTKQGQPDQPA